MRHKVTIVGSGNVGATVAQRLVEHDLADVVLLDILSDLAQGKALDILESAPLLGFNASITGGGDYALSAGSDLCILTAGLVRKPGMSREDLFAKNHEIVRGAVEQLVRRSPDTVILVVTNPLDAMCEVARRASGLPRGRVLGMAGVLDAARLRYFVAHELGVAPHDVTAMVFGGHTDTMLALPRFIAVDGVPVTELVAPQRLAELIERARDGGNEVAGLYKQGSAYYTPSASVFEMAAAILEDRHQVLPCSAYLEGEYGIDGVFAGVPCKLGRGGVESILELALTDDELASLRRSAEMTRGLASRS